MSYSISRPLSKKYASQLLRSWNADKTVTHPTIAGVTRKNLHVAFPSDALWISMDLVGRSLQISPEPNDDVALAILSLVCQKMLMTNHDAAKVLLTFVDDSCAVYYKYLKVGTPKLSLGWPHQEFSSVSIVGATVFSDGVTKGLDSKIQDWEAPFYKGSSSTKNLLFWTLCVWVSAFQSFIEMTDYRYEIWGFNSFNEFAADFVL